MDDDLNELDLNANDKEIKKKQLELLISSKKKQDQEIEELKNQLNLE